MYSTFQPPTVFNRTALVSSPNEVVTELPPPEAAKVMSLSGLVLRISRQEMLDAVKLQGRRPRMGTRLPPQTYSPVNYAPGVPEI